MSFFGGTGLGSRRGSRWTVAAAILSVCVVTGVYLIPRAATAALPGSGVEAGAVPPGATLLPNGRLVRPAGLRYNLGDFSLGLAVAPNSRCAATTDEGW